MKDKLLKYMDLNKDFRGKATAIEICIRQNQKVIERLIPHLRNFKGKDSTEIDRNEFLKDFCIKTAETNESVLKALNSFRDTFQDILADLELIESSRLANTITYQSEVIADMMEDKDRQIKITAHEVRTRIKGTA